MDIEIAEYSDKSFVVRGDTKPIKECLKALGGKWNPYLKGGKGWIFSNSRREEVEQCFDDLGFDCFDE